MATAEGDTAATDERADTAFGRQLAVEPDGAVAGRYLVDLDEQWNCPFVPHGGLVTSVAVRAMQHELAQPEHRLRSVTVVFAGQVVHGPAEIDVAVLRRGRSMSQVEATVRSSGQPVGHRAIAVFGDSRPGFEFTDLTMPDVPPPAECPSFRDPRPDDGPPVHFNFWDVVDGRPALGHPPWEDYVPESSERCIWYRFDEPPLVGDGRLDPLALVTLADTMPGAVWERMGPGVPQFFPPSADLTVHLLAEPRSPWILGRNRARHAGDGYASVELELWDPAVGLVAYGTQMMVFTFPDGPPPPELRRPLDLR